MHTIIQYMPIMFCHTYALHIYYVGISITSIFVRTSESTLELHNALYNIAENIFHMRILFKLSGFQPRQFNRDNPLTWYGTAHYLADYSVYFSLIFCKFIVGTCRFAVGVLHPLTPL